MLIRPMLMGASARGLRPQDVFATSLYTGNGTGTQTITNGLNLAAGGLVWAKSRSQNNSDHTLWDTARGARIYLSSNQTMGETNTVPNGVTFNSNGFTLNGSFDNENANGNPTVAWGIKFAPRFCVAVTYAGDGTSGRQIPHGLGIAPGMIIIKRRDTGGYQWIVYHRSLGTGQYLSLNSTNAAQNFSYVSAADASTFTLATGSDAQVNGANASYEALVFAHDPNTTNGIIQCGSYVTNTASPGVVANLGWQPQFVLLKKSNDVGNWFMFDAARDPSNPRIRSLLSNTADAEGSTNSGRQLNFLPNGFQAVNPGDLNGNGDSYVYLAIRAPIT